MRPTALPQTMLRGRRLIAARIVWIIAAALVVGIYIAAVPVAYAKYQIMCEAGAGCDPYWLLTSKDVIALHELGLSVGFYAAYRVAAEVFYGLIFWAVGALIFWRKPGNWVALLVSLALIMFGALNLIDLPSETNPYLGVPGVILVFLGFIFFFIVFYLFPDGRFVPRWTRWLVPVWVLYLAFLFILPERSPLNPWSWPPVLRIPIAMGLLGTVVFAQIYRYMRVSGPVERQQIKWVVFGLTAAIAGNILVTLPMSIFPGVVLRPGAPKMLYVLVELPVTNILLLLIPLSIGVAILHYRLWDIDVIINRTLVYGSLTTVLAGVFAITDTLLLPLLVESILGEEDSTLNAVISAVIIATLFEPLRRRIKVGVNRLTDWLAGGDRTSEAPR